jgi:DNA-binding NarL/FixJ family response regulator
VSKKYGVIVYNTSTISDSIRSLQLDFKLTHCQTYESLLTHAAYSDNQLLLIDDMPGNNSHLAFLDKIKSECPLELESMSVIVLSRNMELDQRLLACELGADDCMSTELSHYDMVTRIQSTIFNAIANKQLKDQLRAASDVAMAAMASTGDLGANIQFLLDSYQCQNFDQLGQLLFQSLNHYGISCSLQMRGKYKVKNMEANGMERTMESRLLSELKDAGRFYDFGNRTVINYNRVSILIKNMPLDDPEKYGQIKDNIFALLQGTDAKIEALDMQADIYLEHQSQETLIRRMESGIENLGSQYRDMTVQIAGVVNQLADSFEQSMQTLLLTDEQEKILLERLETGKNNVYDIFEHFSHMDDDLSAILKMCAPEEVAGIEVGKALCEEGNKAGNVRPLKSGTTP